MVERWNKQMGMAVKKIQAGGYEQFRNHVDILNQQEDQHTLKHKEILYCKM